MNLIVHVYDLVYNVTSSFCLDVSHKNMQVFSLLFHKIVVLFNFLSSVSFIE